MLLQSLCRTAGVCYIQRNADGESFDIYYVFEEDYGQHANELIIPTEDFSGSKVPKTANWDWEEMMRMRAVYESKMVDYSQYPSTFQDTRESGMTTPEDHRIAVADSFGLFPNYEVVYISDEAGGATDKCYSATYEDGSFTAYYGSKEVCGDIPNRLDTTEDWRILMRVYRPGESVSSGNYEMPEITVAN